MKGRSTEDGKIINHSSGIGTVTREMVLARARELALVNGRPAGAISDADWDQAKREMVGEEVLFPRETPAESLPESERWDPTPTSVGHKVGETPIDDEQTDAEKLVEQGLAEAEHDRMVEGAKQSIRDDFR
jgi:hypothetical protein